MRLPFMFTGVISFFLLVVLNRGAYGSVPFTDSLMIRGDKNLNTENRTVAFTNKAYGQYYSEASNYFTDGWMGWTLREQRIFNDYAIINAGKPINRETAEVYIYPHKVVRRYQGGISEQFVFADYKDAILIQAGKLPSFRFVLKGIRSLQQVKFAASGYKISVSSVKEGHSLFIMSNALLQGCTQSGDSLILELQPKAEITDILLCVVPSEREAMTEFQNRHYIERTKQERIEKVLRTNSVTTNNKEFNQAFLWAVVYADALVAQQDMKGIFAGLPWFNNFWGRDTFISLAGCTYTLGNYHDARQIILAFLNALDTNPQSAYYGRVPNRITLTESIYNTADGTPRLIAEAEKYYRQTGDTMLLKIIYPKIVLAFRAAVERRTDEYGFLTHADAETWMDAVGPDGPWSPRGNRAVDIQALWLKQLSGTAYFAAVMKDTAVENECTALIQKLTTSFRKYFLNIDSQIMYDRLTVTGEKDSSFRPNFYVPLLEKTLFTSEKERIVFSLKGIAATTTAKGVYSLAPYEKNFHPYHQYPPYYDKDAAYHNGIIWQWNTGPAVSLLTSFGRKDLAWEMTKTLTNEILYRGMAGGIAELTDAFARNGETYPRLSGTFLQAWSVAEYIRNVYEDYAGALYNKNDNTISLQPALPSELNEFGFTRVYDNREMHIQYMAQAEFFSVTINPQYDRGVFTVRCSIPDADGNTYTAVFTVREDQPVKLMVPYKGRGDAYLLRNGEKERITVTVTEADAEISQLISEIRFNTDALPKNIAALTGPSYPLLNNSKVVMAQQSGSTIISSQLESELAGYKYPKNPVFKEGIAELKAMTISEDADNYYFRLSYKSLTNPGWHNEYGFQLTYTSICIQTENDDRTREVRRNSNFLLPEERAFTHQINIGGGVEVRNAKGEILVAYLPIAEDVKNPLGNIETATVQFALPKKYLDAITKSTKITVLTGLQDDHGGAGIGEFREVKAEAEEWNGGGRRSGHEHNVYSILRIN